MPQLKYKCDSCSKEFQVKYIFIRPEQITCPHCGSLKVQEEKNNSGCGCKSGSRFT